MGGSVSETTYLVIRCATCGEDSLKPVSWLVSKDNMTCKGCSAVIDLKLPATQFLIKEAARHCEGLESVLNKRG